MGVNQTAGINIEINIYRYIVDKGINSAVREEDVINYIQKTVFPIEVKDLTKRIRTVLMATAQMKEHLNDKEMLIDLQYSLAKSYASTPELRRTWLESMAKIHIKNQDYSEAAHCYIHIAALVAEYLRRRDVFPQGCRAFRGISPNVEAEESGMRDDSGMQDVQYTEIDLTEQSACLGPPTEENLVELLEECAEILEKAERYELLGELYRLIIPIYERRRAFVKLAECYARLQKAYNKVVEVMSSGKRMLGKYFRVAFFGQAYFEDEDGKEYIYKEPKITALPEICERLRTMYSEKYGRDKVELIKDSTKVNPHDLDPGKAYIQVTYVTPYFDARESEERETDFERNNNLRRFMYETPFTKNGQPRGEVDEQFKRRTILTTSHSFPYVKKRILVVYHKEEELSPIEVAIDEMKCRVAELEEVTSQKPTDLKRLQLKLQGSVSSQVHAGPMAYAEAFLAEEKQIRFRRDKVTELKQIFREFISVCSIALDLNGRLIEGDQLEYQENMRQNFRDMVSRLSDILEEQLYEDDKSGRLSHRGSMTVFSVISSTGSTTNV